MTPREKAEELIDKLIKPMIHLHQYPLCLEAAIECALIAVDEVIESLHEHHWQNRNVTEYYREVKQEIEKL
jgi:SOS response regulatory protein OraA/RecX